MRVLLCGADGFLGRHIASALAARGHEVVRGVHRVRLPGDVPMDYRADTSTDIWLPRLARTDVVINAVGILRENLAGDFELVHQRAPAALFEACQQIGVSRVVQISALGTAETPYLTSKRRGDAALRTFMPEAGIVVRPGLVFGTDGASTRFFLMMASLPIHADARGAGEVQPVHVEDLSDLVIRLVEGASAPGGVVEAPGPTPLGYRDWMASYRAGLGLASALRLPVPSWVMSVTARLAGAIPGSLLGKDTWAMLRAGNVGDATRAAAILGRPLTPPQRFIAPDATETLRLRALAQWRRPFAIAVLALVWFASAVLSAGVYPDQSSLALLAPFGFSGTSAVAVLSLAIAADFAMGVLTIWHPGPRLWKSQLALIVGYSLLVASRLSTFLIHPFGPILKNLAVVALLIELWAEEKRA